MTYKTIEFVCTGNNGRSPIARAIAQDHLEKRGLGDEYHAISSGTHAEAILAGNMAVRLKKTVIVNGSKEGICRDQDLAALVESSSEEDIEKRCNEDPEFKGRFEENAERCRSHYAKKEDGHCHAVAKGAGIENYLDGNFKQTKASNDTIAVMAMGASNLKAVQEIYAASGYNPLVMEIISRYVKGDGAKDVPNTFGKSREAYRAMVEVLRKIVPEAVEKIIKEYEESKDSEESEEGEGSEEREQSEQSEESEGSE